MVGVGAVVAIVGALWVGVGVAGTVLPAVAVVAFTIAVLIVIGISVAVRIVIAVLAVTERPLSPAGTTQATEAIKCLPRYSPFLT